MIGQRLQALFLKTLKKNIDLQRSGIAGIFAASLELTKEGLIKILQKNDFDKILIKEKK